MLIISQNRPNPAQKEAEITVFSMQLRTCLRYRKKRTKKQKTKKQKTKNKNSIVNI